MSKRGSQHSSRLMDTIDVLPQKEEWALINKYKALEFERMKSKDRELDRIKKQQFRRELDKQLSNQSNEEAKIKQQDKLYYQRLSENAEEQRQREERIKIEKMLKRRTIENENQQKIETERMSRVRDGDTGYHLEIGMQSQVEHKQLEKRFRKEMMDTLDVQLREKEIQAKRAKIINQQIEKEHFAKQADYFKPAERKMYGQNQQVYNYYRNILSQKEQKAKQIEHRFVDQAIEKSIRAEDERQKQEEQRRAIQQVMVKKALDSQVEELVKKRKAEHQVNPEQISYGFISSMFEDKYKHIDKQIYKRELQKQAEEHKQRKIRENHMSPQEYRLNLNQLSKIVSGNYAQQNYVDRSLGAIGDHHKYELDTVSKDMTDKDAEVVKHRLEVLRNGNHSFVDERYF